MCRFFYLSNFISFILKVSVPSPRYTFSKKNIEQLLFFSKIEVMSLSLLEVSYKIILIGSRSKLISLQMLDISRTLSDPKVREYRPMPSSYLIWTCNLKSITSKED